MKTRKHASFQMWKEPSSRVKIFTAIFYFYFFFLLVRGNAPKILALLSKCLFRRFSEEKRILPKFKTVRFLQIFTKQSNFRFQFFSLLFRVYAKGEKAGIWQDWRRLARREEASRKFKNEKVKKPVRRIRKNIKFLFLDVLYGALWKRLNQIGEGKRARHL